MKKAELIKMVSKRINFNNDTWKKSYITFCKEMKVNLTSEKQEVRFYIPSNLTIKEIEQINMICDICNDIIG